METFEKRSEAYNRNVFIVATICCVAILALCILYLESVSVIGPGLTFGAVFTLFYGLALAFSVQDDRFEVRGIGGRARDTAGPRLQEVRPASPRRFRKSGVKHGILSP